MDNHNKEEKLCVYLFDGACVAPLYDIYLYRSLKNYVDITLISKSYSHNPKQHSQFGVKNKAGILDFTYRFNFLGRKILYALNGIEYIINLLYWTVKFIFKPPEIVHIQWFKLVRSVPFEIWFSKILLRRKIKLVYTVHNVLPMTGKKHPDVYRKIYSMMNLLICHTKDVKNTLVENFGISSEKIHIIPHGPFFHDFPRKPPHIAKKIIGIKDKVIVLFFGGMRPYKGVEFLLETWKKVLASTDDAVLILAGSGNSNYIKKIKKSISKLELDDEIIQKFQFIDNEELPIYHQAADILVYPYSEIYQSGAFMTGITFGKAIIATRIGVFPEIIEDGENGFLVDYGDTDDFQKKLLYLIKNPDTRKRFGKNIYEKYKSELNWDTIAQKTVECYKNIIENCNEKRQK